MAYRRSSRSRGRRSYGRSSSPRSYGRRRSSSRTRRRVMVIGQRF